MKVSGIVIGLLLISFLSAQAQEQKKLETCADYRDGHFMVKENFVGKKYTIKRDGDTQIETDPDGTVFRFDVDWIGECTYTLTLEEIQNNPNGIKWMEDQVITVEILNKTEEGYIQQSKSDSDNLVFEKEMIKIEPSTFDAHMEKTIGLRGGK